jgi:tRNA nucleotidyltransferase (CCA-adding enzyme)
VTALISVIKSIFKPSLQDSILLVGGSVRDLLLGRENRDIDLVTAISHDELLELGFRLVEPTSAAAVYFMRHPEFGNVEITRINNMADLGADLLRRDFTINAMAMDLNGTLHDPLHGAEDLNSWLLRVCSERAFTADPIRIFRAFRFEADGWRMTPETSELIGNENWDRALNSVPVERFSNEMLKALAGKTPEQFFQRMIEFNVGSGFLPELFRMPQIPAGPLLHHPEGDLFSHSIQVLQRVAALCNDPLPRFCALFHDIGKLATTAELYPRHHGHDHAGFEMAVKFCDRLRLSSEHRKALAWTSSLHGKANLWDTLRYATRVTMAEQAIKGGIIQILPLVAAADKTGNPPMTGWELAVGTAGMNTKELGIDPEHLEAMPISKRPSYIMQKRIEVLKKSFEQFHPN